MFRLRRRVRIAYEPIPWRAQGDQKIEEKTQAISEPLFLAKTTDTFKKRAPKGLQKGAFISGVAPLGAPLELQADFGFKKWAHSAPKVPPGTQTCFKNDPQRAKNDPKSDSESVFIGDSYTGPQIWTEALPHMRHTTAEVYCRRWELMVRANGNSQTSWTKPTRKTIGSNIFRYNIL